MKFLAIEMNIKKLTLTYVMLLKANSKLCLLFTKADLEKSQISSKQCRELFFDDFKPVIVNNLRLLRGLTWSFELFFRSRKSFPYLILFRTS